MSLNCLNNRLSPLLGVLMTSLFGVLSVSTVQAECGGYVTIGNKAKLRELQAKGYLPANMNSGHKQTHLASAGEGKNDSGTQTTRAFVGVQYKPDAPSSHSKRQNTRWRFGLVFQHANSKESPESSPVLPSPCSGPTCKSGKSSTHVPGEFVPSPCPAKPAHRNSVKGLSRDNRSGFVGFASYDDSPISFETELDRPPE